jgi:hypothetical protein
VVKGLAGNCDLASPLGDYEVKLTANACIALCRSKECNELFISSDNEALSVAMRVSNPDYASLEIDG